MRRYVIGLDEAGLGPNLGPLVIGATVWSVPADCATSALWTRLESVLTNQPQRGEQRLHVADSKQVHQSQKGLQALERGVLSFWALHHPLTKSKEACCPSSQLIEQLAGGVPEAFSRQPWYAQHEMKLPVKASLAEISQQQTRLKIALSAADIQLESTAVEIICPERFNQLVEQHGNKGALLSHATFLLLQRIWPQQSTAVEVLADKHGGRNRYLEFLQQYFPGQLFFTEKESLEESRYRNGKCSFAFAMQSERHLPVALASMTAKYIRELCMERFNQYWQTQRPCLKPTKGYPQDARRFRSEIADLLEQSPALTPVLWRNR